MAEKTFFGCIDYRNAKFQGSIRDNLMDGIGIVLDNEYMLSLTNWKNDMPYGPSLVVFPNRSYVYGKIKNKQLQEICSYVTPQGDSFYFNFINGQSENIAYLDHTQAIIELTYRNNKLSVVRSHPKQADSNQKWRIISDLLRAQVRQEYTQCKKYVQGMIQSQFPDLLQCSDNANLTFVGFKNSASLGFKLDRNNKVRQVGNFQEFPRNLEFGRKITDVSRNGVKIQEGKFSLPQSVHSFKDDKRSMEAIKQTENYFKKGTNFKNQFVKLNLFVQLSKYLSSIKSELQSLKVFEFGQRILQKDYESVQLKQQSPYITKEYDLQQVKKDIINAANRRNKITARSPLRQAQIYESDRVSPLAISRKRSKDKFQYTQENKEQIKPRQFERSKDKYHYVQQALKPIPNNTQYKYQHLVPEVSDFDPRLDPYIRNRDLEQRIMLSQKRAFNNLLEHQIRQNILQINKYEETPFKAVSPIGKIYQVPLSRDRSPYRFVAQRRIQDREKSPYRPPQSKYQNYMEYKNRKKQQQNEQGQKYRIYERKVLGPSNLTPQKQIAEKKLSNQNLYKNTDRNVGIRHKKNYKYVE